MSELDTLCMFVPVPRLLVLYTQLQRLREVVRSQVRVHVGGFGDDKDLERDEKRLCEWYVTVDDNALGTFVALKFLVYKGKEEQIYIVYRPFFIMGRQKSFSSLSPPRRE